MPRLRIAILGGGGIAAKMHLPALADLTDRCEVRLIAGRRTSRLERLAGLFGVPHVTTDYNDAATSDDVDAVIIATPHPHHVAWGIKALEAGKHLMVQKPLCGDRAEADAFVAAVETSGRTVMCLPDFSPAIYAVRRQIADGVIGKVATARARTSHGGPEVYYREVSQIFEEPEAGELWFFDAKQASVGALFDMGVYAVAQLVALLGSARRVTARTATLDKPTELEDTASLLIDFASGVLATAETSWCDAARTWQWSVHGTAGKFTNNGNGPEQLVLAQPERMDSDHAPINHREWPAHEVEQQGVGEPHAHWLDCIDRGVHPPLSHAWAARHVTEILLAGLESARQAKPIDITTASERLP
ncbi:MAG: Gfo/Idh/MocA family oxidoreductase [Phycisphaeraceae bacterium]